MIPSFNTDYKWPHSFFIIYVLSFIHYTFLGSFLQSVYFLLTFKKSLTLVYLNIGCFFLLCLCSLCLKNFFKNYLIFLLNPIVLDYCKKTGEFLKKLADNKSQFLIIFMYSYIGFALLHMLMHFFWIVELLPEMIYHFLNMIRLVFFPFFIVAFILQYSPLPEVFDQVLAKTFSKASKEFAESFLENGNIKKNPKIVAFITGTVFISGAAVYNKSALQNQFDNTMNRMGLDLKDPSVMALKNCPPVLELGVEIESPASTLLLKQISSFWDKENDISGNMKKRILSLKLEACKVEKKQRELSEAASFEYPPLAKTLTSKDDKPKIPSILEDSFFDFL